HHSLPPDHDDHRCRTARCAANRIRLRIRRRSASAAGPGGRRRPCGVAADHAVSDAGRLHVSRASRENQKDSSGRSAGLPRDEGHPPSSMNISQGFIQRPIATSLLMAAIALFGAVAYRSLPVSDLPNVDFPTLLVTAQLPGASPETMGASVATPLENQ